MRTVMATRYVTPLREGGSLPALVEADDDGLYVLKFRGAGQGPRALVAELFAGELGRALDLPVPELVLCELDPRIGGAEPDPEIQDLLKASAGLNVAMDFLPGALAHLAGDAVDAALAAGERLLATARRPGPDHVEWPIPDGYEGASGKSYLGYAHGIAGIADALLDLYEATGDERFLDVARAGGRRLATAHAPGRSTRSGRP